MKTKVSTILVVLLMLIIAGGVVACGAPEQSLEGMVVAEFQFNGGVLDNGSTNITGSIYHAYAPDSLIIDISNYMRYTFTRYGYTFEGWYTDDEFAEDTKWDFAHDRITSDVTLYAKWVVQIVYSYGVYLVEEGEEPELLGSYTVQAGDRFDDKRGYGSNLSSHDRTFMGYYSDKELSTPWNDGFIHPGGEESTEIPVYVDSIPGVWTFVSDYDQLTDAIDQGRNIMLTADIDCGGKELFFGDFGSKLEGKDLDGNIHTISNFVVNNSNVSGSTANQRNPEYSIFGELQSSAKINNVLFDGFTMNIVGYATTRAIRTSALALGIADGAEISNVTVRGSYTLTLDPNADRLETTADDIAQWLKQVSFSSYKEDEVTINGFSAEITLKQD